MKTFKRDTLSLFAVLLILLGGCTAEIDDPTTNDGIIRITGINISTGDVITRAVDATTGYDGMVKSKWVDGDELTLTFGGDFQGKVKYRYQDENDNGWKIYGAENKEVSEIVITKTEYKAGINIEAKYAGKSDVEDRFKDVLLAKGITRSTGSDITFGRVYIDSSSGMLVLSLVHTKSYITANVTNNITEDAVRSVQLVLKDAESTTQTIDMKANEGNTAFEVFADRPYVEKFIVTLASGTTYDATPPYGQDGTGFIIKAGNHYPFNITLDNTTETKAETPTGIRTIVTKRN